VNVVLNSANAKKFREENFIYLKNAFSGSCQTNRCTESESRRAGEYLMPPLERLQKITILQNNSKLKHKNREPPRFYHNLMLPLKRT